MCIVFGFATLGCSMFGGGLKVQNLDRPLSELQRVAVASLPLGLRRTSPNAREFYSHYFIVRNREFMAPENAPERAYAVIYVLGDRRPYTMEVSVFRERREGSAGQRYGSPTLDLGLAEIVKHRVEEILSQRREDRNIIDDFRVF